MQTGRAYGQTGREYTGTNIYGDWKVLGRKKDARISSGKERSAVGAEADMACHDCMGQVDLEKMKETDIREADINALADILEIKIDCDLSSTEKKREFIRQIKNPYLYRQGEYVVKLSFADTDATLTDRLKEYIEHMVAAGL